MEKSRSSASQRAVGRCEESIDKRAHVVPLRYAVSTSRTCFPFPAHLALFCLHLFLRLSLALCGLFSPLSQDRLFSYPHHNLMGKNVVSAAAGQ